MIFWWVAFCFFLINLLKECSEELLLKTFNIFVKSQCTWLVQMLWLNWMDLTIWVDMMCDSNIIAADAVHLMKLHSYSKNSVYLIIKFMGWHMDFSWGRGKVYGHKLYLFSMKWSRWTLQLHLPFTMLWLTCCGILTR